jgi:hypothetical protein
MPLVWGGLVAVVNAKFMAGRLRPGGLGELEELGLTLVNGKQLLAQVQQAVVAARSWDHGAQRPTCRS